MPSAIDTVALTYTAMEGKPSERKRHRDEASTDTPKRPKKAKDLLIPINDTETESPTNPKKEKHSKHNKKAKKEKKEKKDKKDKKENIAHRPKALSADAAAVPSSKDVTFPFFTQTVSLWVPLYPVGFDRPLTSVAHQHIAGLVNHYSPLLGGYLLSYRNVNLAEDSARADPANPPTDATPATLVSVDEYAVGFAWMTADVDLFVPSRGAWLEGSIVLQNEGAIGVSCWEKFNASIEAARLPQGWKYIDLDNAAHVGYGGAVAASAPREYATAEEEEDGGGAAVAGEQEALVAVPDMQASGYWVDEDGMPVTGKVCFRIKEFDVGLAGDNGYLAIEGTMLSEDEERSLLLQERARKRGRIDRLGGKLSRRPLPEFSITQFGKEEEEEDSGQRVEVYKGSCPGTPDD